MTAPWCTSDVSGRQLGVNYPPSGVISGFLGVTRPIRNIIVERNFVRNRLNPESDRRCALSQYKPQFEDIIKGSKCLFSH